MNNPSISLENGLLLGGGASLILLQSMFFVKRLLRFWVEMAYTKISKPSIQELPVDNLNFKFSTSSYGVAIVRDGFNAMLLTSNALFYLQAPSMEMYECKQYSSAESGSPLNQYLKLSPRLMQLYENVDFNANSMMRVQALLTDSFLHMFLNDIRVIYASNLLPVAELNRLSYVSTELIKQLYDMDKHQDNTFLNYKSLFSSRPTSPKLKTSHEILADWADNNDLDAFKTAFQFIVASHSLFYVSSQEMVDKSLQNSAGIPFLFPYISANFPFKVIFSDDMSQIQAVKSNPEWKLCGMFRYTIV